MDNRSLEQRVVELERKINSLNQSPTISYEVDNAFKNRGFLKVQGTGTEGQALVSNGPAALPSFQDQSSGGSPGGADTNVQFNDGGSFGGDAGFTYDKINFVVTVNGIIKIDGANSIIGVGDDLGGIELRGADSVAGNNGGNVNINGGTGDTDFSGGDVNIQSGFTTGGDADGSNVYIDSGAGSGEGFGGEIAITAGEGGVTDGEGGSITITSGDGNGNADGGQIFLNPGSGAGTGHEGDVLVNGSISTGANGGFLVIPSVAGTPTGTPINNGSMVYDTNNNKLYVYNGSWKSVTLT